MFLLASPARTALFVLVALAWLSSAPTAIATAADGRLVPVIEAGREGDILGLLSPLEPGAEIAPGWRLGNVGVERSAIRYQIAGPDGARATVELRPPGDPQEPDARTGSFQMYFQPALGSSGGGPDAALTALAQLIRDNDDGSFWRTESLADEPELTGTDWWRETKAWLTDGLLVLTLILLGLVALVLRELAHAPARVRWALLGVVALTAITRLVFAEAISLQPWTFSRVAHLGGTVYFGRTLETVLSQVGGSIYLTDALSWICLLTATATPLGLFVFLRRVTRDDTLALAAGVVLAVLPQHIRFSRSDVDLFDALFLAACTLAFLHVALSDRERRWRLTAAALAVLPVFPLVAPRPLNVLFVPLMAYCALWLVPREVPWLRRGAVFALLLVPAVFGALDAFGGHSSNVASGVSLQLLRNAAAALFAPAHNTLIDPWATPPLMAALALLGAYHVVRRHGLALGLFLAAWLFGFFLVDCFILAPEPVESARYHLRLVLPFATFAAAGAVLVGRRHRLAAAAVALGLLASPLLHTDFQSDMGYDSLREFAFIEEMRHMVPEGCTVLEYQGPAESGRHSRVGRLGTYLSGRGQQSRWRVVSTSGPSVLLHGKSAPVLSEDAREILADPPRCLYAYQGLMCWSEKDRRDPIAPACAALPAAASMTAVASEDFEPRPYNDNHALGFHDGLERIELRLFRIRDDAHPQPL